MILRDCVERDEKAHFESNPIVQLFAICLGLALILEKTDIAVESIVLLQICFFPREVNNHFSEIFLSDHVKTIFSMLLCTGNMERRCQNMCAASFLLFLIFLQLLFDCAVWRPKIRFVVCSINVPSELIVQIFAFGESNGTRLLVVRCAPVISKPLFRIGVKTKKKCATNFRTNILCKNWKMVGKAVAASWNPSKRGCDTCAMRPG